MAGDGEAAPDGAPDVAPKPEPQPEPPAAAKAAATQESEAQKAHNAATPFRRFLAGPYFDVIPAQFERVTRERAREQGLVAAAPGAPKPVTGVSPAEEVGGNHDIDYLGRLKHIVMNPVDVDGVYGLTCDELVPLPFDTPKWHAYLVDVLSGTYLVAQATIVMFIAIYVENQERSWKSGNSYTTHWLPLVKALIIVYPLITLIMLVTWTVEYTIRKFMYFRLLSMRILVDWHNQQPWGTVFFWYFMATWAVMNAWAIYGVAAYYNKNGNSGVDPVSFGTFVVVNLQTVQLLLYYMKLLTLEQRLVSLNQIFERAPVEAQRLLEFTYVIEEQDLIDECYHFAAASKRTLWRRLLNIATCCLCAKDWNAEGPQLQFDIKHLQRRAPNYAEVERNVNDLRREVGVPEVAPVSPDAVEVKVDGGAAAEGAADADADGAAAAAATEAAKHDPSARPPLPPFSIFHPVRLMYQNLYASLHSLHVTVMLHFHTWPFRADAPYFRLLTFMQWGGIIAVGAIVVLGWLISTRESNCTKSAKTCNTCLTIHERYFDSDEPMCSAMETAIAAIAGSTTGTWDDNGVTRLRYCNFQCAGNFTASPECPPVTP